MCAYFQKGLYSAKSCLTNKGHSIKNILIVISLQDFYPEDCILVTKTGSQCTFCHKMFTLKGDAKRHILSVHSGVQQQVNCGECGKTLKNKKSLGHHLRTIHGLHGIA